jgi:hypothetical protein
MNDNNIVVYNNGEIELKVSVDSETVWLNREQISNLFDRDIKTIGKHINNIFKEGELIKEMVIAKFATTTQHGAIKGKTQTKLVEYYNLDVIISVGYRVKSQKAIKFRQWATSVLKNYITNGYAINSEKITNERFVSLEKQVNLLSEDVNILKSKKLKSQGIFFNGASLKDAGSRWFAFSLMDISLKNILISKI